MEEGKIYSAQNTVTAARSPAQGKLPPLDFLHVQSQEHILFYNQMSAETVCWTVLEIWKFLYGN